MQKTTKVIVTIVIIVVWLVLSAVNTGIRSDAGYSTPGIIGIILLVAMIGAIRAVWKKDNDDNNGALQK